MGGARTRRERVRAAPRPARKRRHPSAPPPPAGSPRAGAPPRDGGGHPEPCQSGRGWSDDDIPLALGARPAGRGPGARHPAPPPPARPGRAVGPAPGRQLGASWDGEGVLQGGVGLPGAPAGRVGPGLCAPVGVARCLSTWRTRLGPPPTCPPPPPARHGTARHGTARHGGPANPSRGLGRPRPRPPPKCGSAREGGEGRVGPNLEGVWSVLPTSAHTIPPKARG